MLQDRVTIIDKLYFEPADAQPIQIETGYDFRLETTDQVYVRKLKASSSWSLALDPACWLGQNVSMIHIENTEGKGPIQSLPSEEEKRLLRSRFLIVSLGTLETPLDYDLGGFIVYPGQGLRLPVLDASKVILRCPNGIAKYTVTAIPR